MGAAVGRETDIVVLFASLAEAPYRFDFYQTLRRLECLYPDKPLWGEALRPVDEIVRLGQDPELSFAPAPVASFQPGSDGSRPRLHVRLFGLLGPNGPLPIHITEFARERMRSAGDPTFCRFLDIFNHRFMALFYRAWAQAQPHVNRDRPDADRFAGYIGSFIGLLPETVRRRDAIPDVAKFFHVGALVRHVRNSAGLQSIVQHFFQVPTNIEEFVGHWMALGPRERTFLGREGAILGAGAVVGKEVWDRQHKFRLALGPLTLMQYESFLPGGTALRKLVEWARLYLSYELEWDVRLVLDKDEVPALRLGTSGRLGWTTWLGRRPIDRHADDLCLRAENFFGSAGASTQ